MLVLKRMKTLKNGIQRTKREGQNMQENTEAKIQCLDSEKQLAKQEELVTSENLPRTVSLQLLNLMKSIVADDVNPQTVSAACKCASEIHKMIKINIELIKLEKENA